MKISLLPFRDIVLQDEIVNLNSSSHSDGTQFTDTEIQNITEMVFKITRRGRFVFSLFCTL